MNDMEKPKKIRTRGRRGGKRQRLSEEYRTKFNCIFCQQIMLAVPGHMNLLEKFDKWVLTGSITLELIRTCCELVSKTHSTRQTREALEGSLMSKFRGYHSTGTLRRMVLAHMMTCKLHQTTFIPARCKETNNIKENTINVPTIVKEELIIEENKNNSESEVGLLLSNPVHKQEENSMDTDENDNMIPIQSTHLSLAWPSVKIGKCKTRELTIRNISNNDIQL